MEKQEKKQSRRKYPWKGFLLFVALYLVALATHYPVLHTQAEIYIGLLDGEFAYTPSQFALSAIIQPALLGLIAIFFGHRYAHKVNLRSLLTERVEEERFTAKDKKYSLKDSVPFIVTVAIVIAVIQLGFDVVFQKGLPEIYQPNFQIPSMNQALSNVFYSGLGQELLLRWGVMTIIIYVVSSRGENLSRWSYILGFVFTAILYAFAQYNATSPFVDLNGIMLLRILLLNGLSGILYGWLYATFHFEASALSHMLTNSLIILGTILIVGIGS